MKVIIAPQTFKGSLSALDVAKAMREGVLRATSSAETVLVPVADGGDGTLETLIDSSAGETHTAVVTGPLGEKVDASWGAFGDGKTAIIEMARSSGLALIPTQKRDPNTATTYGLGELIKNSLAKGFRNFIIGIGGSATNDAGAGMAQALGVRLLDKSGNDLPVGGAALSKLDHIDTSGLHADAKNSHYEVACDVTNPLTGPEGASHVYGPQKGASPQIALKLDAALVNFSKIVKRDIGLEIDNIPGSGAAGGLGGGLIAFLGANLRAGVDIVLDAVGLKEKLVGANLVITGEGQMDFQTVYNKAPIGVAKLAKQQGIPVIGISGSLGPRYTTVHEHGIDAVFSITTGPMSLEQASQNASDLITSTTEQSIRLIQTSIKISD